jgi:hypothetical protein
VSPGAEREDICSFLQLPDTEETETCVPESIQRIAPCTVNAEQHGIAYRRLKGNAQPKAVLNLAWRRSEPSSVVRNFMSLVRRDAWNFRSGP